MSSIIVAGGQGTRIGREKATLEIAGQSLLERTIHRLSKLDTEIILVLAQGQKNPLTKPFPNVKIVADVYAGRGPLVGIYSGLKESSDQYSVAVACDMPFLNTDLLRYMAGLAPGYDAVVLRIEGMIEPLHAVYSKSCLDAIAAMIEKGRSKVKDLFDRVRVRYVQEAEIDRLDPERLSWFNINTPEDFRKAEDLLSRESHPE
ncbi:MAG: molybdenum cofactor guanylyltransferase [Chloroflexi bacterium]|nr:molybdenum cofactor guanylyltransferase [Chloroflexota bacterium]